MTRRLVLAGAATTTQITSGDAGLVRPPPHTGSRAPPCQRMPATDAHVTVPVGGVHSFRRPNGSTDAGTQGANQTQQPSTSTLSPLAGRERDDNCGGTLLGPSRTQQPSGAATARQEHSPLPAARSEPDDLSGDGQARGAHGATHHRRGRRRRQHDAQAPACPDGACGASARGRAARGRYLVCMTTPETQRRTEHAFHSHVALAQGRYLPLPARTSPARGRRRRRLATTRGTEQTLCAALVRFALLCSCTTQRQH